MKRLSIGMLVVVLAIASAACSDDQVRKAAEHADRLAMGVETAIQLKHDLKNAKLIDDQEDLALTLALLDVNRTVSMFQARIEHYRTQTGKDARKLTPEARADLKRMGDDVINSLAELHQNGVLHVKNEKSRRNLTSLLNSLQRTTAILMEAL